MRLWNQIGRCKRAVQLRLVAAGLFCVLLSACGGGGNGSFGPDESPERAVTTKGAVRGVAGNGIVTFKGIPYAAPPTGDLRFRAPQPRAAWQGELDASKPGSPCPQTSQTTTEDCLYLNVTRPQKAEKPLPVLMFVHGGGFTAGSGDSLDGTALAKAGVIVVTINYRMGVFGYLAHPAIETMGRDSGMYGVQDAHAALRWVRENIAAFGGDPDNVTMGGHSAGAMTTCLSSASADASSYFGKMIVASGPCAFQWPSIDQKYVQEAKIPEALGCIGSKEEVAKCLRSPNLTVSQLLAVQRAQPAAVLFPSVGGIVAPIQPRQNIGKKPVIMGYAAWELLPNDFSFQGTLGAGTPNPQDLASYVNALTPVYGANASAVAAAYPLSNFQNGNSALNRIEADIGSTPKSVHTATCTDVRAFEIAKSVSNKPLFAYQANDPNGDRHLHIPQAGLFFPSSSLMSLDLSQKLVLYWSHFIRNGDPNATGLPAWPSYSKPTDVMQLTPGALQTGIDVNVSHNCLFWNSIGYGL